jgi:hypothetical protein
MRNILAAGGQEGWYTPIIPALRRQRQEDCKFMASLGYLAISKNQKTNNKRAFYYIGWCCY